MKSKTLITLCCSAFLSSAIFMQAQAYNFGTGINTNFGTGVGTTFGSGLNSNTGSTLGSGLNINNGSTFGSGLNTNFGTTYGQGLTKTMPSSQTQSSAATLPNSGTSNTTTTQTTTTPQVQVRNHYFFVPWGFGGTNYTEATPATKASETSSPSSSNSNATSVEASSANLYKISVDLGQFNNKAENVKLSVNNHTIKVYGGKYSQTFQIEKKIVKSGIRKEVSGNTLIIYVPLKD